MTRVAQLAGEVGIDARLLGVRVGDAAASACARRSAWRARWRSIPPCLCWSIPRPNLSVEEAKAFAAIVMRDCCEAWPDDGGVADG